MAVLSMSASRLELQTGQQTAAKKYEAYFVCRQNLVGLFFVNAFSCQKVCPLGFKIIRRLKSFWGQACRLPWASDS